MQTSVAPSCPGFDGFLRHGLKAVEVAVLFARAAAEGAKLASDKADVGEIDIAIDDVGDQVADQFAAQHVGRDQQSEKVVAFGIRQQQTLFAGEHAAIQRCHHLIERVARFRGHALAQLPPIRGRESLAIQIRIKRGPRLPPRDNAHRNRSFAAGRIRSRALPRPGR